MATRYEPEEVTEARERLAQAEDEGTPESIYYAQATFDLRWAEWLEDRPTQGDLSDHFGREDHPVHSLERY